MIMCVCRGEVMCPDFLGWRQKLSMADDVPGGRGGRQVERRARQRIVLGWGDLSA